MKIRWHAERTDDALWPSVSPVVVAVQSNVEGPASLRGWQLGSQTLARAPEPRRATDISCDVLAPGGTAILQQRWVELPREGDPPRRRVRDDGVYRVDVATGVSTRAGFEPRDPERIGGRIMAPAPGAESAVVIDGWMDWDNEPPPEPGPNPGPGYGQARAAYERRMSNAARLGINLVTFDGEPARELAVLEGHLSGGLFVSPCQWSPDGRLLALSVAPAEDEPRRCPLDVLVFDTTTWQVVARIEGAHLEGSASWGPESDRLLVGGWGRPPFTLSVWIHHLDGTRQPVTVLPEPDSEGIRAAHPLGMADNDHLLTLRNTSTRSTLMRTTIADGTHEGIVTWPGGKGTYPVVAQMPPEAWA